MHAAGYLIAQIFFGLWPLPLGYLVYRSGSFRKVLGVLLAIGCFGYLIDTFTNFLPPASPSASSGSSSRPRRSGSCGSWPTCW
jgi:hypothetical protein